MIDVPSLHPASDQITPSRFRPSSSSAPIPIRDEYFGVVEDNHQSQRIEG
jgi:hypothetical protein